VGPAVRAARQGVVQRVVVLAHRALLLLALVLPLVLRWGWLPVSEPRSTAALVGVELAQLQQSLARESHQF
jgi:hypothetical protein